MRRSSGRLNGQPRNGEPAENGKATVPIAAPISRDANYNVSVKAFRRWADERLTLTRRDDGTIEARFRYEGTTCTNMGARLAFDYRVVLGARARKATAFASNIAAPRPATRATLTCAAT